MPKVKKEEESVALLSKDQVLMKQAREELTLLLIEDAGGIVDPLRTEKIEGLKKFLYPAKVKWAPRSRQKPVEDSIDERIKRDLIIREKFSKEVEEGKITLNKVSIKLLKEEAWDALLNYSSTARDYFLRQ